ncbi:hypothetical protein H0H87_003517 [Tephrocybe sp. NHM501043]|nr:hypothetical protein H0H87_003517 [Tephrocybe sp. NHM501043]
MAGNAAIKAIDKSSVHQITSGQVVIDLQTAVKEMVENSLDAGATNIEVRFKQHGLKNVEVIDNGSGIPEDYHDSIALKHYTSKLSSFSDLATVRTFGFRGEALSSLCALSESLVVNTTTEPPMGVSLEMDANGKVAKRSKIARQRGTTIIVSNLFKPLPVRRKEFERNVKREFGKALASLNAYALIGVGVRLTVSNIVDKGHKTVQLRTSGASTSRDSVSELWGPKALDNIVDLDLSFEVERDRTAIKRAQSHGGDLKPITVTVKGLISKFSVGGGRTGTDRQFFYVNGRPCNLSKVQKSFNEVYRSHVRYSIFYEMCLKTECVVDSCDINVSPDKRTIFLHSESNMIVKLKTALEEAFATSRSTYEVDASQSQQMTQSTLPIQTRTSMQKRARPELEEHDVPEEVVDELRFSKKRLTRRSPLPRTPSGRPDGDEDGDRDRDEMVLSPQSLTMTSSRKTREPCSLPETSSGATAANERPLGSPASPTVSQMVTDRTTKSKAIVPLAISRHCSGQFSPRSPAADESIITRSNGNDNEDQSTIATGDPELFSDDAPIVLDTSAAVWNRPPPREEVNRTQSNTGSYASTQSSQAGRLKGNQAALVTAKTRRDGFLKRLNEFARSGSQVSNETASEQASMENVKDKDKDKEVEANEIGSLNGDPANQEGQTGSSTKMRLLKSHLPSSSADERGIRDTDLTLPSSPVDVDLDTEIGQSSSTAIDLTSEDGFDDYLVNSRSHEGSSTLRYEEPVSRPEVIRTSDSDCGEVTLRFDLEKISDRWRCLGEEIASSLGNEGAPAFHRVPSDAGVSNTENDDNAVKALARIIDKNDFAAMEIVGQFNLGFILARRRKGIAKKEKGSAAVMDDLFIVDQHAADEKYNFETLQQTTIINSQKLFRPRTIELTASDELVALENIDVLRQNGFDVEEVEVVGDDEMRHGARLQLTAQPVSKSTVFDMKDLEELIHLMRDRPTGQMVRCSKARAMFAMRACRKSVMVGMPLNKKQMATVFLRKSRVLFSLLT